MSYRVIFDEEAIDFLNKLETSVKERIFTKIMVASKNPLHFFVRLVDRPDYKLRIGDYRAIADIDKENEIIKITLIGHRKNIYD